MTHANRVAFSYNGKQYDLPGFKIEDHNSNPLVDEDNKPPQITIKDGYWYINGECTGVKAHKE